MQGGSIFKERPLLSCEWLRVPFYRWGGTLGFQFMPFLKVTLCLYRNDQPFWAHLQILWASHTQSDQLHTNLFYRWQQNAHFKSNFCGRRRPCGHQRKPMCAPGHNFANPCSSKACFGKGPFEHLPLQLLNTSHSKEQPYIFSHFGPISRWEIFMSPKPMHVCSDVNCIKLTEVYSQVTAHRVAAIWWY